MRRKIWINTRVEFVWNPKKCQYEEIKKEGYWYNGKIALATNPPYMEVEDWAFYNDGTESGSSKIGNTNQNPTLTTGTIYHYRQGLQETSGNASKNTAPQLQYKVNAGSWVNVTASSPVVQAIATDNIADGADTTQRITAFTYDSTNEGFDEVDGIAGGGTADLSSDGFEALYSFQIIKGSLIITDTISLKIVDSNNSDADYDAYNQSAPVISLNFPAQSASPSDTWSLTDQATLLGNYLLSDSDTLGWTDQATALCNYLLSDSDALGWTDEATLTKTHLVSESDNLSWTEQPVLLGNYLLSDSDTLGWTDQATVLGNYLLSDSDTLSLNETFLFRNGIIVNNNLTLSESLSAIVRAIEIWDEISTISRTWDEVSTVSRLWDEISTISRTWDEVSKLRDR